MLTSIWYRRRQACLQESQSEFDRVFRYAQRMFSTGNAPNYHIHIHFNDHSTYQLCMRYAHRFRVAAKPELERCTFVTIPEDSDDVGRDTDICIDCHNILIAEGRVLNYRTAWRNIHDNKLRFW